jgi:hypothetical protein
MRWPVQALDTSRVFSLKTIETHASDEDWAIVETQDEGTQYHTSVVGLEQRMLTSMAIPLATLCNLNLVLPYDALFVFHMFHLMMQYDVLAHLPRDKLEHLLTLIYQLHGGGAKDAAAFEELIELSVPVVAKPTIFPTYFFAHDYEYLKPKLQEKSIHEFFLCTMFCHVQLALWRLDDATALQTTSPALLLYIETNGPKLNTHTFPLAGCYRALSASLLLQPRDDIFAELRRQVTRYVTELLKQDLHSFHVTYTDTLPMQRAIVRWLIPKPRRFHLHDTEFVLCHAKFLCGEEDSQWAG